MKLLTPTIIIIMQNKFEYQLKNLIYNKTQQAIRHNGLITQIIMPNIFISDIFINNIPFPLISSKIVNCLMKIKRSIF